MVKHSAVMDLLKCVGCPALINSNAPMCSHSSSLEDFHSKYSEIIEEHLLDLINNSLVISIIVDESTDASVQKRLFLYVELIHKWY